jgi:hypothetical protein
MEPPRGFTEHDEFSLYSRSDGAFIPVFFQGDATHGVSK